MSIIEDDMEKKYGGCILVDKEKIERMVMPIIILRNVFGGIFGINWITKSAIYIREREEKINKYYWDCLKKNVVIDYNGFEENLVEKINEYIPNEKVGIGKLLYSAEKFNGLGYRSKKIGIESPYIWSGTNLYKSGKYIRDGVYRSDVVDKQCGVAAVMKYIEISQLTVAL